MADKTGRIFSMYSLFAYCIADIIHNVEHIESEELDRQAVQIMQLVGVREGTVVLLGFTRDDVDQLLDVLCCD